MPERSTIEVTYAAHVAAFYHVLTYFDLAGDPWNTHHAAYAKSCDAARAEGVPSPARSLGAFHARYRAAKGRSALHMLPLVCRGSTAMDEAVAALVAGAAAPAYLSPLSKRAMAPLADAAGVALVTLTMELVASERAALATRLGSPPSDGLGPHLDQNLLPLLPIVCSEAQTITVFPCEALVGRARSLLISQRQLHVAVASAPSLRHAFFHVLLEVVRHRTDRILRPFLPDAARTSPDHPRGVQMRQDAALTAVYHLFVRKRSDLVEPFSQWALTQVRDSARQPKAVVAALFPWVLVPDEAQPAIRALIGEPPPLS